MVLTGSVQRLTVPASLSRHHNRNLHNARSASSHRLHAQQPNVSSRRQRFSPCCDSRPGAPEPIGEPNVPGAAAPAPGKVTPSGRNRKQDAARGALQDMFKGKEDLLAIYDDAPGGGSGGKGNGKGGQGGGGGGGGGGGPDENRGGGSFWSGLADMWRQFMGSLRSFGKALGAFLLVAVIVAGIGSGAPLWPVIIVGGLISMAVHKLLGLQGPGEQRRHNSLLDPNLDLGSVEAGVISMYDVQDFFKADKTSEDYSTGEED